MSQNNQDIQRITCVHTREIENKYREWTKYLIFYEIIMLSTPNIVLLIMFVIGVILATVGISMTYSDMIDDVANHSITPHLLPLGIGIVLIGVSLRFGLKKVAKFLAS